MGRWGEKVPPTGGTVADRLALVEPSTANRQWPRFAVDGADPAAGGTGLRGSEGLGLLFEAGLQGPFGEAFGRGLGNLLHGVQIDVEVRPLVAKGAAGDDFAPLGSVGAEFLEFLGGEGSSRHGASCLEVRKKRPVGFLQLTIGKRLGKAKRFMTSVGAADV